MKILLWDIDGTLLDFGAAETVAIRKCFEIFEMGECTDEMLDSYKKINRSYWEKLERGEMSKPDILVGRFHDFFEQYGLDVSKAPAFNLEYQVRLGDTVCFQPNGLETVQALKGKILQYAVTNGTKIAQERKLKNSGLDELLDGVFISDIIGVEKPDVRFFDEVFRVIGPVDKSEVLIVGDSLTSDILGGNNAGIVTCWYNPNKQENHMGLQIDMEIQNIEEVKKILGL